MACLPTEIQRDIVRRIGEKGFIKLSPFIKAGKKGTSLAYDNDVLRCADVTAYMCTSRMANDRSKFRPFLLRCVAAGNVTASYVEGLHQLSRCGPSEYGLQLLAHAAPTMVHATFALGVFRILLGDFPNGDHLLTTLLRENGLPAATRIGDFVLASIVTKGTPAKGLYKTPGTEYQTFLTAYF